MIEDRELALLTSLKAGLEGESLASSADLAPAELAPMLVSLKARGLVASRGWLRARWELTELGAAAIEGWEAGVRLSLASLGALTSFADAPLRREEPSLPFAANTSWKEAVCINIAVDPDALRPLVPDVFELDLAAGSAWVSMTASRLSDFGVGRLPRPLRMNFYQATYRAHVRYRSVDGELRRGCYFVRSDTNSALMSATANLLPEFEAHRCGTCPIVMARDEGRLVLTVDAADPAGKLVLVVDENDAPTDRLPETSRFGSLEEAHRVIVDFTDSYAWQPARSEVFVLRIERGEWHYRIPRVIDAYLGYAAEGPFPRGAAHLDSVFTFREVPYRWLPLIKERVVTRKGRG